MKLDTQLDNLTGKMLISMPYKMVDSIFHESVIYIVYQGENNIIGFVINYPITDSIISSVINRSKIAVKLQNIDLTNINFVANIGGPVEMDRCLLLHSADYSKNNTVIRVNDDLAVSSDMSIIEDCTKGLGPKELMFVIGYTSWTFQQFKNELESDLWIISHFNRDLIFSRDSGKDKWINALYDIELNYADFVPYSANS